MRPSLLLFVVFLTLAACAGPLTQRTFAIDPLQYGVPRDSASSHPYPDYAERALHTLTSMARIAPTGFRDIFLAGYPGVSAIMTPAYFPPTNPVYWNRPLIFTSRFHAEDMAVNGCFQYNSCDGTSWATRIQSLYTESGTLGELIGRIPATALDMVKLWLYDGGAPDGSPDAGHRALLLSPWYEDFGCGHAIASADGAHLWVEDFGGGDADCGAVLVAGSHFFEQSGLITFRAVYHTPTGSPQSANVELEGSAYPMYLEIGQSGSACYRADVPLATDCRRYRFVFRDAYGVDRVYPGAGRLYTTQEGGCSEEYEAPSSAVEPGGPSAGELRVAPNPTRGAVFLEITAAEAATARVDVLDVTGRRVRVLAWPLAAGANRCAWDGRDQEGRAVPPGVYLVRLDRAGRTPQTRRVVQTL